MTEGYTPQKESAESELDDLKTKLRSYLGIGMEEKDDYDFREEGDTLVLAFVKAFQRNVQIKLREIFRKCQEDQDQKNPKLSNVIRNGNEITADLINPIGNIKRILIRGDKDM